MKRLTTAWVLLGLLTWSPAHADLPYTFKAGDPIRASELNANFQYLDSLAKAGSEGPLVRRDATLRGSGFNDVVTVPSTATQGWVLRSYGTGCGGDPILRIENDPSFTLPQGAELLVRAGETLYARCPGSSSDATIGYFMFDEQ